MRQLAKILVFTAATLVLGCLLAPPLYWLGNAVARAGLVPDLAGFEFHRYFNRAVLLAAAILVWPLLRALDIRRWSDLGLAPNRRRWRDLLTGFVVASVGLWAAGGFMLLVGRAQLRARFALDALPGALLSAVVVALIEESFFRGALLGALRRTLPWRQALAALSLVFAAVHFLKPPPGFKVAEVSLASGFELVPRLFWQYAEPTLVAGGLVTILLVGLVLGYAVVRTRSLYLALGLHCGWVFALKGFGQFARLRGPGTVWFGGDLLTGLAPVLLVAATGALVSFLVRERTGGTEPFAAAPSPEVGA